MLEIFEANSGDAITLTVVGGGYLCRRWAMTSGSARTLCDMTQPKRELPKFFKWLHIPYGLENSNLLHIVLYIGAVGCHDPMPWRAIDLSAPVKVCLGHQLHAALHVSTLQTPCRSWRLRVSLHEKMQNKRPSSKNMRLVKQLNTNA